MYKLFVSDFYKTLLDSDDAINLSTMVEIDRIRKNGCLFVIATGSLLSSVLDYNRDFPFIDYIIACNGSYTYDVNRQKVLYKKNIMPSLVKKIQKIYSDNDIYFYTADRKYLFTKDKDKKDNDILIKNFLEFYNDNKNGIYKIDILFNNKKQMNNSYSEIGELNLKLTCSRSVISSKQCFLEITPLGITKMTGIEKICKLEKISTSQTIAVGDGESDISMIKDCGMGVAVGNAIKELKAIANMKSSSNDSKGVEKVIKKLL